MEGTAVYEEGTAVYEEEGVGMAGGVAPIAHS
eukprot:CAMPEP_0115132082 /NCGR_PEP_ID=MMETSP0227-20121206/53519_1 /TAXON_ID=89957 /ORGANISM="Polarella glacialis, Strain CCMP 1383" /LENGTH=31 /DNA_ID= /DNA_START= /DNA_END= /DNA_ORIENTATION=